MLRHMDVLHVQITDRDVPSCRWDDFESCLSFPIHSDARAEVRFISILTVFTNKQIQITTKSGFQFMVRWVVGSILHGGPIELVPIPASAPRLV